MRADFSNLTITNKGLLFLPDESHLFHRPIKRGMSLWIWDAYKGPRECEFLQINRLTDQWVRVRYLDDYTYTSNLPSQFFATKNELIDAKINHWKSMKE